MAKLTFLNPASQRAFRRAILYLHTISERLDLLLSQLPTLLSAAFDEMGGDAGTTEAEIDTLSRTVNRMRDHIDEFGTVSMRGVPTDDADRIRDYLDRRLARLFGRCLAMVSTASKRIQGIGPRRFEDLHDGEDPLPLDRVFAYA